MENGIREMKKMIEEKRNKVGERKGERRRNHEIIQS
jgi:hypothetical protein